MAVAADLPEDLSSGAIIVTTRAHEGTNVRWGRSVGVVDAPMSDVMKVVSDYGAYHEFMPHFEASRVLSQRGERALVYMEALIAKKTLKVWAELKITPEQRDNARIVSAHMTKGNLAHMEARWEVSALPDGRSLVTFDILVDPKLPLPASLVTSENEKASSRTIRALRDRLAARAR
jgi:ribosome-associated toxin RatA of RatAB toxin-antitoxin module